MHSVAETALLPRLQRWTQWHRAYCVGITKSDASDLMSLARQAATRAKVDFLPAVSVGAK
jgi:hypothetical protein